MDEYIKQRQAVLNDICQKGVDATMKEIARAARIQRRLRLLPPLTLCRWCGVRNAHITKMSSRGWFTANRLLAVGFRMSSSAPKGKNKTIEGNQWAD